MTAWRNGFYSRNKYKNTEISVDGLKFDSKKEARRYKELKILESKGEIKDLKRQVRYTLIPAQREDDTYGPRGGVHKGRVIERECSYMADFVYKDKDGQTIVEDTKGMRTKEYVIKRKLMLFVHGIRVREF